MKSLPQVLTGESGFTPEQIKKLEEPLYSGYIKQNQGNDYIEGFQAIKNANNIFGFDGWSDSIREMTCVLEEERQKRGGGTQMVCAYRCIIKVEVYAGDRTVRHEGEGYGTGYGNDRHEAASKEAETDALKRALRKFGNQFGLSLYAKDGHKDAPRREASSSTPKKQPKKTTQAPRTRSDADAYFMP